jgi:carboxyl-terminal processing protease
MEERSEEEHLFNEEAETTTAPVNAPQRRSRRTLRMGALFALILAVGFMGGLTVGAAGGDRVLANIPLLGDGLDSTPDPSLNFNDFWKVYNVLQDRFVQTHGTTTEATSKDKVYAAIQGLVTAYGDPYTVFFPPEQAKMFQESISGNFSGVGMEIGLSKEGILTVIAPLKGTPAEKAGIMAGDLVLGIDGKSTEGVSTDEAVKRIRGEKGTTVTFIIQRAQEKQEIKVVRDTIQVPTIDTKYDKATGVYTIALYEFSANSGELFDKAFTEFRASGSKKLIIDLRGNPGGYLDIAVQMASHFLPKGAVVVTEDYNGNRKNIEHVSSGSQGVPEGTEIVVLIDQGSASASEILAGALQDHDVATLVGTRSFGKGSVQELVQIGKASLKITVARWLTPSGTSISDGGLTPDIKVTRTPEEVKAGKDVQMERAVQFLTTGS